MNEDEDKMNVVRKERGANRFTTTASNGEQPCARESPHKSSRIKVIAIYKMCIHLIVVALTYKQSID